jgi:hypothetical protein
MAGPRVPIRRLPNRFGGRMNTGFIAMATR